MFVFRTVESMRSKVCPAQIILLLVSTFCLFVNRSFAQNLAPGGPGKNAQWASAGKQGVGTSANPESKVWFTLQGGALSEVYYPDVTVANVHLLQFVVVNANTEKVETELDDAFHNVEVVRPDSLTFRQTNTAKSGEWKITKIYTTDVERDSVLINIAYECNWQCVVFAYYDPSISNSGMHDTAFTYKDGLIASDGGKSSALVWNAIATNATNGFLRVNDGLTQLQATENTKANNSKATPKRDNADIPAFRDLDVEGINSLLKSYEVFNRAENGNVVQFSPLPFKTQKLTYNENGLKKVSNNATIALGFGKTPEKALQTARTSLQKGFVKCLAEYDKGWSDYVNTLSKVEPKYQAQFNMAAMILKAHEDKTARGANIASLTVPWGGGNNANENTVAGYHLIWARDLYQVATAYVALGDKAAAGRALDFLFKIQQKQDGSFPQNSFLDGKPFGGSLQLDEVAFPLILAYQLGRNDRHTYQNHVKRAADFIVKTGPKTMQERWEEESGFSPSTIAAEIAGLVCAAEIAKRNGDAASVDLYLKTADDWAANVEKWTATTTGKYGDGNYYLRITQHAKPNSGDKIELNNGAGFFDEREIVDAGFLELVRLGIKSPADPVIQKSLIVVDEVLSLQTPNGTGFYRYNHDGYGEMDDGRRWNFDGKYTGKGRLWTLLSGERGQYEVADCYLRIADFKDKSRCLDKAKVRLDAMLKFANEVLMIPEQVWDQAEPPASIDKQFVPELRFGEGTGSATPLAWSAAQFIRLAVNVQAGRNLETPAVVFNRYVKSRIAAAAREQKPSDYLQPSRAEHN